MTDVRPQWNEEAVGANHPIKADVINRAYNVEHDEDGTHNILNGQSIDNAIDALISTHTSGASAHHAKYTDAEARAAVVEDAAYGAGWNADTTHAPSQNAVYDILSTTISDLNGFPDALKNVAATAAEINTPLDGALVTLTEFRELETIGNTTISAVQWGHLGNMKIFNVAHYGAVGNGSTVDTTSINNVIAALNTAGRGILYFPATSSYYKVDTANLTTITVPCIIEGDGIESQVKQTTTNKGLFDIASPDNIIVRNIRLTGPGAAYESKQTGADGLHIVGASAASPSLYVKIENVTIDEFQQNGILMKYVDGFEVSGCYLSSLTYAGMQALSCKNGRIHHNFIYDIKCESDNDNGYGIAITNSGGTAAADPFSEWITVDHNIIKTVSTWEGLDTHGGHHINFIGNEIYDCMYGIVLTSSTNLNGSTTYNKPENIIIANNLIDSSVTDGSAKNGIEIGSTAESALNIECIGNTVIGYGTQSVDPNAAEPFAGIRLNYSKNVLLSGNTLVNCSPVGIVVWEKNYDFLISGNNIVDPWAETDHTVAGVYVTDSGNNTGFIDGINVAKGDKSATYEIDGANGYAFYIANAATNDVSIGTYRSEANTKVFDGGQVAAVDIYRLTTAISKVTDYLYAEALNVGTDTDPGNNNLAVAGWAKVTDYIVATGGLKVGADADPGTDNLIVAGTSTLTGTVTASGGIGVTGNITVTGTVDTVDIAALKTAYDTHAADTSDPHGASITLSGLLRVADYLTVEGGIYVGGTADPGTDNLIVDGNLGVGLSAAYTFHAEKSINANYLSKLYNTNADGHGVWIKAGNNATPDTILKLDDVAANTRFAFYADGTTLGFSPTIGIKNPTPGDYLDWALEDALKPKKPSYGNWNSKKARSYGIKSESDEREKYGKDALKISIGATRWAEEARIQIQELDQRLKLLEMP